MTLAPHGPASQYFWSHRMRLHYVDWGNEGAPPLVLVHGGRDHCRNWDWVAERLRRDWHILAPDLRGHGDSAWVTGANYGMIDYVYDLAQLIHQKKLAPVTILAHSLGGSISLSYTGIYPESVAKIVAIEGLGPPPAMIAARAKLHIHERMIEWIEQMRSLAGRSPRKYASIEEAFARMQGENPRLTPEQARHLTVHGVNQNEDGTFSWKFDNYVRAFSPYSFNAEEARELWGRITCPALLVRGTESWASDPLKDGRAAHFKNAQVANIEKAGHWVHHDQLEKFLEVVTPFFGQMTEPREALAALWSLAGCAPEALERVTLSGVEPVLPSSFRVGTAAQASIAAAGLAASELWRLRTGRAQRVSVDLRDAALEFRSERYLRVDGQAPATLWDPIAGLYRAGDGRWLRLHTNFPHHRALVVKLLACDDTREAVQAALAGWSAEAFETAANGAGGVVSMLRSAEQWNAHPQAQAIARLPVLEIERIGDAPPRPLAPGPRPLSGVRVLDLTRVVAGPVCGRTLAAHGADVLRIASPSLPFIHWLVIDTGRGKRSAFVDLATAGGRATLARLVAQADVFVQGYRPGGLAKLGFAPEDVARMRPGIVVASLSAYSHVGPWSSRRGFDSLVQTATGFNHEEGRAAGGDRPRELPAQALDHGSGQLMAFAALAARARQAREGGSYLVRASLAQTGRWLWNLGRVEGGIEARDPALDEIADRIEESDSAFGRLRAVRHAAVLSETPAHFALPAARIGTHEPRWEDGP